MISVDLSITMTAAVPNPDCTSLRASKSILRLASEPKEVSGGSGLWVQHGVTDLLGKDGDGAASGDDSEEIIPSASDTAAMPFDQVFQWD
jgi:hypothetical protein